MTGTGLKKCIPTNCSRRSRETASARRWIAIDEVFEAKIAAGGASPSSSRQRADLTARSSKTASMTRSAVATPPRSAVGSMRAKVASRSSWLRRPLATARSRLDAIRSRPASARARSGSYSVDRQPDRRVDLRDAVAHQAGAGHEDTLDRLAMRTMVRGRHRGATEREAASPTWNIGRPAAADGPPGSAKRHRP